MKRLLEIFWRCTFDYNRRAWRDCYHLHGGIIDDGWGRVLLLLWADWALMAGFDPLPRVSIRRRYTAAKGE